MENLLSNSSLLNSTLEMAMNDTWPAQNKGQPAKQAGSGPAPISPNVQLSLYICMGIIALIGIIGNVCVCFIISNGKKMYTIANLFLMNLAIADIMILAICFPLIIIRKVMDWPFGHVLCKILPALSDCFYGVSMGCITAIAIYRYRMILHSMTTHMTFKHAKIAVIVIWLIALGIISAPLCWVLKVETKVIGVVPASPSMNISSSYVGENVTTPHDVIPAILNSTTPTFINDSILPTAASEVKLKYKTVHICRSKWPTEEYRRVYQITQISWYILPLSVILFTYLRIRRYLNKTLKYEWVTAGGNNNVRQSGLNSRVLGIKRALTLLAPVVITFALLMFPWTLFRTLSIIIDIRKIPHIATYVEVSGVVMMANSCCNPFIYYIVSKEFRDEFRKRFRTLTSCFKLKNDEGFSAVSRSPSYRSQTRVETVSRFDDENYDKGDNGFQNSWKKYAARVPESPLIRETEKRENAKLSVRFSAEGTQPADESTKLITLQQDPDRETII